jgi:hypothetical protein
VNTFVIISGDSDFSPLVSKLRENAKQVIGVGVKQSTSDLLVANCDEFIFYDDLVREVRRAAAKRDERKTQPAAKRSPDEGNRRKEELEARKAQAIELVVEMFDALVSERGDSGKIWASLLKDTLKRRRPDFNETYYGFRTFGNLLEEAQNRGMLEFGRDEKSGAYVYRSSNAAQTAPAVSEQAPAAQEMPAHDVAAEQVQEKPESSRRRGGRGGRKQAEVVAEEVMAAPEPEQVQEEVQAEPEPEAQPQEKRTRSRGGARKTAARKAAAEVEAAPEPVLEVQAEPEAAPAPAAKKAARKAPARPRRPAKAKAE